MSRNSASSSHVVTVTTVPFWLQIEYSSHLPMCTGSRIAASALHSM